MINICEIKSILETIIQWDEWLGDDPCRKLSNDCMLEISDKSGKILKILHAIEELGTH